MDIPVAVLKNDLEHLESLIVVLFAFPRRCVRSKAGCHRRLSKTHRADDDTYLAFVKSAAKGLVKP